MAAVLDRPDMLSALGDLAKVHPPVAHLPTMPPRIF
jgi:hypothetical protein